VSFFDTTIIRTNIHLADNIGGKNGCKPAFQGLSPSPTRLTTKDRRIHAVGMVLECLLLANNELSGHVAGTSALPLTADIQMEMSASLLNSSDLPSTADAIRWPDYRPDLTQTGQYLTRRKFVITLG